MRSPSILCCLLVVACGSDPAPPPDQPHCRALAKAWCERFYDCYTPDQIAAEGLPRNVGDCIRELELSMECADPVPATSCGDGFELDPGDAAACVGGVRSAVCSQLADVDNVAASCDAACEPVFGACTAAECNPADPDACGAGAACRLDAECGAVCVDGAGLGTALDACRDDGDCAAGHTCADALCTELCDAINACTEGRTCTGRAYPDAGVRECSDGCIPGRGECGAGMTCAVELQAQAITECVAAGDGQQGEPCASDGECAPDFMCLTDAAGAGHCLRGCDADNRCPSPQQCFGWSPPAVIRGVTFGSCQ